MKDFEKFKFDSGHKFPDFIEPECVILVKIIVVY